MPASTHPRRALKTRTLAETSLGRLLPWFYGFASKVTLDSAPNFR
jgi:hypothetical protein